VSNDMGDKAGSRAKLMTGMAFVLGAVTAFQASGLQLYFLVSGVLGAGTGWLLRQNGFRRFIRISPLPSKESQEVYTKVVKGQVRLADIKDKDGKVRYQAPRPINMSARRGLSGITIKEGTELPAHLRSAVEVVDKDGPTDRDEDYAEGPKGSAMEKLDYYRRNYRLSYMWKRAVGGIEKTGKKYGYVDERSKEKRRADAYEIERRRRFENRK
jgi:YidC/Oxa1 family membrane protein insertase